MDFSDLGDLVSAAGGAFSNIYRTVSPPQGMVWNPAIGQYQAAGLYGYPYGTSMGTTSVLGGMSLTSLLLIGGVAYLLLRG